MSVDKKNSPMASNENPSFAAIEDMHANQPDVFAENVKRLVSMQENVTETRKEVTSTVNFLSQGCGVPQRFVGREI